MFTTNTHSLQSCFALTLSFRSFNPPISDLHPSFVQFDLITQPCFITAYSFCVCVCVCARPDWRWSWSSQYIKDRRERGQLVLFTDWEQLQILVLLCSSVVWWTLLCVCVCCSSATSGKVVSVCVCVQLHVSVIFGKNAICPVMSRHVLHCVN